MEDKMKKELEEYLAGLFEEFNKKLSCYGVGTFPSGIHTEVAKACIRIFNRNNDIQTVEDCVFIAKEIAKEKYGCNVEVTVTYKDQKN